ncbi:hypothetical protein Emin_0984 [Elusimicrobium minutum Pei191]|uniref:Uncharacterized protein n=1 Tax=Elusimicrobium minutum (strain Pei191) TaxID=445932 RepID=B2KDE1_ELUMP|nr:hypothetical protein [Elusimicrobium minutum]ACC98537.1 hypothetical protein Emin_0984 [Elusimicrobium minutum Pei191]
MTLQEALDKARRAANGAIQIWGLTEPAQANAMKQIQEIYEGYLKQVEVKENGTQSKCKN